MKKMLIFLLMGLIAGFVILSAHRPPDLFVSAAAINKLKYNDKINTVNEYLDNEVFNLFIKLKTNKNNDQVLLSYDQYADDFAVSYLFKFDVYNNDEYVRTIKRTYNYAAAAGDMLVISEKRLTEDYYPVLKDKMQNYNLNINHSDLKYFKYNITEKNIIFHYPLAFGAMYYTVIVPNMGIDYYPNQSLNKYEKLIALTFDDGPSPATVDLLDLLDKYQIKATFFLVGSNVNYYSDAVSYIFAAGHEIANHSYSHADFSKLTAGEAMAEIATTQELIYRIIGSYPKFFRFPYGSYRTSVLNEINLPIIGWNCDSEDWRYRNGMIVTANVISGLSDRTVVLFHDFKNYHKKALTTVIETLIAKGYRFVTVSEMHQFYYEENVQFGKIYY